jgi:VWFA-related protein
MRIASVALEIKMKPMRNGRAGIGKVGGQVGARLALAAVLGWSGVVPAQSTQTPQEPAKSQPGNDIPDAPSAVQPPMPKPTLPPASEAGSPMLPPPEPGQFNPDQPAREPAPKQPGEQPAPQPGDDKQAPPAITPSGTAAGNPRNQVNPKDDLYKISLPVNFVQVPVMVKDSDGRRVDGLLPKDFEVLENGKKQTLSFFTSDPFELSVAVVLDIGMPDVAVQKVNQTYSALAGAFSPYDEVGLYTYSSTVSQVTDFTSPQRLTATLNQVKLVRGHNNGPPVLGGPLASGPTINGMPAGGPPVAPVNTPPKESHVLNDAILRAALDLSKRDRTRRKVIFVISDGHEMGSKASYSDVLKLLLAQGIQVKAVAVDSAALPLYRQIEKIHLKGQGFNNILPKYSSATGGGQIFTELSRNAIEESYAQITSEARNQYTLGYAAKSTASTAYRNIEVVVYRRGVKVYTKDGYYPIPSAR